MQVSSYADKPCLDLPRYETPLQIYKGVEDHLLVYCTSLLFSLIIYNIY